jgi:nucleotide-binding universal stress UspA family protein
MVDGGHDALYQPWSAAGLPKPDEVPNEKLCEALAVANHALAQVSVPAAVDETETARRRKLLPKDLYDSVENNAIVLSDSWWDRPREATPFIVAALLDKAESILAERRALAERVGLDVEDKKLDQPILRRAVIEDYIAKLPEESKRMKAMQGVLGTTRKSDVLAQGREMARWLGLQKPGFRKADDIAKHDLVCAAIINESEDPMTAHYYQYKGRPSSTVLSCVCGWEANMGSHPTGMTVKLFWEQHLNEIASSEHQPTRKGNTS